MNKHAKKYAGNKAVGLFEQDETIRKLQTMGNPLEALSQVIDFEICRDVLEKALLTPEEEKKSNAGLMASKGTFDEIFTLFHQELRSKGLIFNDVRL